MTPPVQHDGPSWQGILGRCALQRFPGFTEPELLEPALLDVRDRAARDELAALNITVTLARRAEVLPNWVMIDRGAGRGGSVKLSFRGEQNIVVIAGQDDEAADLHARVEVNASRSLAVFGRRKGFKSHITARLWNNDQLLFWGNGATSNGVDFVLQGAGRSIMVGDDCMFSLGIWVRNSDMHAMVDLETGEQMNAPVDMLIEPHVWVGQEAMILQAPRVGYGSIIGARSLVKADVEPLTANAGMPSKCIRRNVSWDRRQTMRPETLEYIEQLKRTHS